MRISNGTHNINAIYQIDDFTVQSIKSFELKIHYSHVLCWNKRQNHYEFQFQLFPINSILQNGHSSIMDAASEQLRLYWQSGWIDVFFEHSNQMHVRNGCVCVGIYKI